MRLVFDAKTGVDMDRVPVFVQTSQIPDRVSLDQQARPVVTSFKMNGVGPNLSVLRSSLNEETVFQFSSKHQFV